MRRALPSEACMVKRLAGGARPLRIAAGHVGDAEPGGGPYVGETGVILGLLEQRQRFIRQGVQLVRRRFAGQQPMEGDHDPSRSLPRHVPGVAGAFRCGLRDRRSLLGGDLHAREVELERDVHVRGLQQLDRALEKTRGRAVVSPPERTPSGGADPLSRSSAEDGVRAAQLDLVPCRLLEVEPDDLVLFSTLVEPDGDSLVEVGANRLGERLVRGIADEDVAEAVCLVAGNLRGLWPDQLLTDERVQVGRQLRVVPVERLHGAHVKHPSLHRTALEHAALRRVELIESRRQERLDGRRHRHLAGARLAHERDHLLEEERVALCRVDDPVPELALARAERIEQLVGLVGVERLEQDGRCVPLAATPPGPAIEELRARQADEQDRRIATEVCDVLDEIQQLLLPPVDVVEHAHDRVLLCALLQKLAEGPRDLLGGRRLVRLTEKRAERCACGSLGGQRPELPHDLDHRAVRDPLPVGEAAAAHNARLDPREELRGQSRLSDARCSENREQLARTVRYRSTERFAQASELALTAHHRHVEPPRCLVAHGEQAVRRNRFRLSLQLERRHRLDVDRVAQEPGRLAAEQRRARLGRLLQARGDVHRVAGREPLRRARHDLTGVDADPCLHAEPGQRLQDVAGCPHRAQRVVLVQHGHAEHRHDGVTHELLDAPAMPLDDRLDPLVVADEDRAQGLRIDGLAERRRAFDVAEEHRHGLSQLARRRRRDQLRPAVRTECEVTGTLAAAARAGRHVPSVNGAQVDDNAAASRFRPPAACRMLLSRIGSLVGTVGPGAGKRRRNGGCVMPSDVGSNVDKLRGVGLIRDGQELPEPYEHVVAGLTDHEVDILVAVKKRLDAASEWHGVGVGNPGELPPFTSFMVF